MLDVDPARKEERLLGPVFLPDGKRFLFLSWTGGVAGRSIDLASLDSPTRTRVMPADTTPLYASGHLLFTRQRTLSAQRFDPVSGALAGQPTQLVSSLLVPLAPGRAAVSASQTGVLAYRIDNPGLTVRSLRIFDRSGKEVRTFAERGAFRQVRLSPNNRWLAVERRDKTDLSDISTMEVTTGIATRLVLDHEGAMDPVWSPDSREVAYTRRHGSRLDIYRTRVGETPRPRWSRKARPPSSWMIGRPTTVWSCFER